MARISIETINEEFRTSIYSGMAAAVSAVNASRDDGFDITTPTDIIGDFDDRHSVATPYCYFSAEEMTSQSIAQETTVNVAFMLAIVFPDYENSLNNRKAYYRYCEAVHRAIASFPKKRYTSQIEIEYIPMGTRASDSTSDRVAGCFVRYSLAVNFV